MKKAITFFVVFLSACSPVGQLRDTHESRNSYYQQQNRGVYLDLCDQENMPRYSRRPRLLPKELKDLPQSAMDARIRQHIAAMEEHINSLESVIMKTRRRVEQCR